MSYNTLPFINQRMWRIISTPDPNADIEGSAVLVHNVMSSPSLIVGLRGSLLFDTDLLSRSNN
jgi:hypothetical protein